MVYVGYVIFFGEPKEAIDIEVEYFRKKFEIHVAKNIDEFLRFTMQDDG